MLSFQISNDGHIPRLLDAGQNNDLNRQMSDKLIKLKHKLNQTKNKLDDKFDNPKFKFMWSQMDPFKNEKPILSKIVNYEVSNAWIKCYELIRRFELIDKELKSNQLFHFDNAAFPGAFILATKQYIQDYHSDIKYNWVASSLVEKNQQNLNPLKDIYHLYRDNPDKWLMTPTNNGDVLLEANQRDFYNRLNGTIDLYTSDLGFHVSDYNNEESIHLPANIGQILSGLLTLKPGGHFITKQFTFFEPTTISVIYALTFFFKELYIVKPYSSRAANSEVYLLGKGFLEGHINIEPHDVIEHPIIKQLLKIINNPMPLFNEYPQAFIDQITKTADEVYNQQIDKINADLVRIQNAIKFKGPVELNPIIIQYLEKIEPELENWYLGK